MGSLHEDLCTFVVISQFFLEWEMFLTNLLEKTKTHILCSITFFENCAVYEINVEKYCTARQATGDMWQHMCIACWITKPKDTHPECVIIIAFP